MKTDLLTRELVLKDIESVLRELQDLGYFLSVTLDRIASLDDVELIFVRRHLRDTARSVGLGKVY